MAKGCDLVSFETHCMHWKDLCKQIPFQGIDALIFDAPYSKRTHNGHNANIDCSDGQLRKPLNYKPWSPWDVSEFVGHWAPKVKGWMVSITDDVLAPCWYSAYESVGRYAFSMVPYVAPGSRVRQTGDGPSAWTCWIMVSRPSNAEFVKWGTLPGAYILPPGMKVKMPIVGGKPPWLMCELVRDYSRPGDLICDPTCGAGTTGIGALRNDRRVILGDINQDCINMADMWCRNPGRPAPDVQAKPTESSISLFGDLMIETRNFTIHHKVIKERP